MLDHAKSDEWAGEFLSRDKYLADESKQRARAWRDALVTTGTRTAGESRPGYGALAALALTDLGESDEDGRQMYGALSGASHGEVWMLASLLTEVPIMPAPSDGMDWAALARSSDQVALFVSAALVGYWRAVRAVADVFGTELQGSQLQRRLLDAGGLARPHLTT